jgi:hypothetical protein
MDLIEKSANCRRVQNYLDLLVEALSNEGLTITETSIPVLEILMVFLTD